MKRPKQKSLDNYGIVEMMRVILFMAPLQVQKAKLPQAREYPEQAEQDSIYLQTDILTRS